MVINHRLQIFPKRTNLQTVRGSLNEVPGRLEE